MMSSKTPKNPVSRESNKIKIQQNKKINADDEAKLHLDDSKRADENGGTDLSKMCRVELTAAGQRLMNGLDLDPFLRCGALRPLLEEENSRGTSSHPQVIREFELEVGGLRQAEKRQMETHAELLSGKAGIAGSMSQKSSAGSGGTGAAGASPAGGAANFAAGALLALGKTAKEMLSLGSLHAGLAFQGKGKLGIEEYPDPVMCDHLKPFLNLKKSRSQEQKVHEHLTVQKKVKFRVQPPQVIFKNFQVGQTFTAKLEVRNAGLHSSSFRVRGPSKGGRFALAKQSGGYQGQVLAPGLSTRLVITFSCKDKEDHKDSLTILAGEFILEVPICAKQAPPTLVGGAVERLTTGGGPLLAGGLLDLGKCFVGDTVLARLRLTNVGPPARFFFINEMDWIKQTVENLKEGYTVDCPPFSLRPAYLDLDTGEDRQVLVGFLADCEGSHVGRLYVLSDSASLRPLDLLAETVAFSPALLSFQGFEKKYDVLIEDEVQAQYYFYLGKFYPSEIAEKTFKIRNSSLVRVKYSWKRRGPEDEEDPLEIQPKEGYIQPGHTTHFQAGSRRGDSLPAGRHTAVFSLYVLDIPLAAIPKRFQKGNIIFEGNDRASIELACLEIWLDMIEPSVILLNDYIHIKTFPFQLCKPKIYLSNMSEIEVVMRWEDEMWLSSTKCGRLVIPPLCSIWLPLAFSLPTSGRFSKRLRAHLEGWGEKMKYEVLLRIEVGPSQGREGGGGSHHLQVSPLPRPGLADHYEGLIQLPLSFITTSKIHEASEFTLEWNEDGNSFLEKTCNIFSFKNSLKDASPSVNFSISKNSEEITYCLLSLTSDGKEHCYIEIICDFQKPDVSLEQSKFLFPKSLNIGEPEEVKLRVRNHKLFPVRYRLQEWIGPDSDFLQMDYYGMSWRTLGAGSSQDIDISVTPRQHGFFNEVFIPIQVEGMDLPLVAQLIGYTKEKEFKISWPTDGGSYRSVIWPQDETYATKIYPSEAESEEGMETYRSSDKEERTSSVVKTSQDNVTEDSAATEPSEEGKLPSRKSTSSNISLDYDECPIIGGKYYAKPKVTDQLLKRAFEEPWTCESLKEKFKKLSKVDETEAYAFLSKNSLFFDLQTFEESTKTIEISNNSVISTKYKIKVNFFKTRNDYDTLDPITIAELQVYGRKDIDIECPEVIKMKWKSMIQAGLGLGLKVRPSSGGLGGHDSLLVAISAYSLTWGLYFDSLQIQLGDLPLFSLPVTVRVRGPPLAFTFSPRQQTALLRFPSTPPKNQRKKRVFLENYCHLPIQVSWWLYREEEPPSTGEEGPQLLLSTELDFTLQLELHPVRAEDFCRLHLTEYLGRSFSVGNHYEMEPRLVEIPAYGRVPLEVSLDTALTNVPSDSIVSVIKSTAVGTVYLLPGLYEKDEYVACSRPDGFQLDQLILKFETIIEVPIMRLINARVKDTIFQVKTRDLFSTTTKMVTDRRRFIFKNVGNRRAFVNFSTKSPFRITRIKTKEDEHGSPSREVGVDCLELIDVELTFILTSMMACEKDERGKSYLEYCRRGRIGRDLICTERDYSEQVKKLLRIASEHKYSNRSAESDKRLKENGFNFNMTKLDIFPLYLELLMPVLEISVQTLNFRYVQLGTVRTLTVIITSKLGDEEFKVSLEGADEERSAFDVTPTSGIFKATQKTKLAVTFTPQGSWRYTSKASVRTSTPGFRRTFRLTGIGTIRGPSGEEEEGAEEDFWGESDDIWEEQNGGVTQDTTQQSQSELGSTSVTK